MQSVWRAVRKTSLVLLLGYGGFILLLPLLWWKLGERFWPLILLRYAPPVLFLLPILLLLLTQRDRRVWAGGALLGLFCLFILMDCQLPLRSRAGGGLSVISYNIRAGLAGPRDIAEYLASRNADIICLQEARAPLSNPKVDPIDEISQRLQGYHMARGGKRGELVIYSRYPILSSAERDIELSHALEAIVSVEGREVRVLTLHLMTGDPRGQLKEGRSGRFQWVNVTAESRRVQFDALAQLLEAADTPTLLTGDFNTPPRSAGHTLLSRQMQDCFREVGAGPGLTYRSDIPLWRIDYIWASPDLTPLTCTVGSSKLSDHKPLTAIVRL